MPPADQADGLRRLFGAQRTRFVALVHNPHVAYGGVVMERLTAAWAQRGLHTLVVDAADSARAPHELAQVELAGCVEPLSAEVSFLAARGLPMRYVDTRGSTAAFLDALATAAPAAQVVLVHASASDLARLFAQRPMRPVLLADAGAPALTAAYGAAKLLAQRAGLMVFDLVLPLPPEGPLAQRVAQRLAECADHFMGAALHDWAAVAPDAPPNAALPPALRRLALALLDGADAGGPPPLPPGAGARPAAAQWN